MIRQNTLSRRAFLKKTGAILPLPFLASLQDHLWGTDALSEMKQVPKRFLAMHFTYGVIPDRWWPQGDVRGWDHAPSLEPLAPFKDDITLLKGISLSRGNTEGGHGEPYQFLNANRKSKISMDQLLAEQEAFGQATRYSSIETGAHPLSEGIAFTRDGVPLPALCDAPKLYNKLFGDDDVDPQVVLDRLRKRKSMLDGLIEDIQYVERRLDRVDREKLDEYVTSVRQIEKKITKTEEWLHTPKPRPAVEQPTETPSLENYLELAEVFTDLLVAAFQTDQTRVASFYFKNTSLATSAGTISDYHSFTHHNGNEVQQNELARADRGRNVAFARLLEKLKTKTEADGTPLLENTLILYGGATEDANVHQGRSLPLVLAGRPDLLKHGRRHGGMVEYPYGDRGLSDLLVTLLQIHGVEVETFAGSQSGMSEICI